MTFKKIGIIIFLIFTLIPFKIIFAENSNVGFIPENIWYSKDPFEEGDKVKIYTLVFNPDERELSGTVVFFDKSTFLGKKDFKAPAKSVKDINIDWVATVGDHVIFAKIENAKFLISKDKYEEVYVAENKTEESKRAVSKKIISELPEKISNKLNDSDTISNLQKTISENTPSIIKDTIEQTTNSLEKIRINTNNSIEDKRGNVKKEIDILNKTKTSKETQISENGIENKETVKEAIKSTETKNLALKPFKYAEYFLLTIFGFILKNKIVFYGLLILIIFWILRFLWRKIF